MSIRLAWAIAPALAIALTAADDPKSGIDKANNDAAVRPQDDLFLHVNGKWLKEVKIPSDRPFDGAFFSLRDKAELQIRAIIEDAAKSGDKGEAKQVGDLYASFMDEARAEELGIEPIRAELDAVAAIREKSGLLPAMALFQKAGVPGVFAGFVSTDAKKSDRYIVYLNQAGLGLPDES